MTDKEALKLALEALERSVATCFDRYAHEQVMSRPEHFVNQAITAIKEALAQPPQRKWVGLTDEEHNDIYNQCQGVRVGSAISLTEAKLKEKNT
jgi:N-methylhydantoinase B/oxoprolinase/acetone carboxylase alpha subunit